MWQQEWPGGVGCIRSGGGPVDSPVNAAGGGGAEKKNLHPRKHRYEFLVTVYKDLLGGRLLLPAKASSDAMCDCP